jgi:Icc-related predicted phosphoesterase
MKILCVSDQIDPLIYSESIQNRYDDVDCILCAGDLPLDYLDFIASSLNKPLFFVFGNYHVEGMAKNARKDAGRTHVGSRVRKKNGLIVAGLGGSMRYNQGANQFTEAQMFLEALKLIPRMLFHRIFHGRFLDILLTHAPPSGIHDKEDRCHRGFKAFVWFIETFKPRYHVHGHIHIYDPMARRRSRHRETEVVNAFGHMVIETA